MGDFLHDVSKYGTFRAIVVCQTRTAYKTRTEASRWVKRGAAFWRVDGFDGRRSNMARFRTTFQNTACFEVR